MAQRDYVSKKCSRLKKRSKFAFYFMLGISIIVILLFITLLYFITYNKPAAKPVVITSPEIQKPEMVLPEKPEERWIYLKQLENPDNEKDQSDKTLAISNMKRHLINTYPVRGTDIPHNVLPSQVTENTNQTATTGTLNRATSGQWSVQCGAFKDKHNAEVLKAQIAIAGFSSQIEHKNLYRVMIGTYKTKNDAEKTIKQLKEFDITHCIVHKN